ncbi:MAG: hypothetical protein LBK13_05480, partial [Spirochaetales bacterium]|nr:hypothetical protein [Spirochaetales bacterium]
SKNIDSLTISLVGSRYPKELLRHLEKTRGYRVEEAYSGIYHVTGDIIPIQIIETARLSAGEHLWLKSLSDDLDISQADSILRESGKKGKDAPVRAYLNALLLANQQAVEEVLRMRNGTLTLEKVLENAGLTKKWIAEGETRGKAEGRTEGQEEKALEIARNLIRRGWAPGDIAEITNLDPMKIQPLYDRPPRGKSGRNR